jgi:hypothetical protein
MGHGPIVQMHYLILVAWFMINFPSFLISDRLAPPGCSGLHCGFLAPNMRTAAKQEN